MKMKKVLSLIMAGAMVLGMSMSACAEETEAASEVTTEAGSEAAAAAARSVGRRIGVSFFMSDQRFLRPPSAARSVREVRKRRPAS